MEGSSLTLFGLLKYNLDDDKFEMTELTGIFTGGLQELKRQLKERMLYFNIQSLKYSMVALSFIVLGGYFHYVTYQERVRAR